MGIGGALEAARTHAGLSITQVSERTRIREALIRGIEHDDYSACGGDYYARGHIRAIASVVGADPVPLIQEYDAAHLPPPEPAGPADGGDAHARRLPGWRHAAGHQGGNGQSGQPLDLDRANIGAGVPGGITAAEAFRPRLPLEPGRALGRGTIALALILVAAIGVLSYLLASGGSPSPTALAGHRGSVHRRSTGHGAPHATGAGAAVQPSDSAAPTVPLTPVTAAAFGPGGTAQGDDPLQASLAIDGSRSTAWQTDWYATADFGGLQSGTGLLLDMGRQVTVTRARILLGAAAGGTIELRAGNTPVLADLHVVARAALPGGMLTLPVASPVRARYLLIWFTSLPPDSAGTYQDSISNVSLSGTS